MKTLSLCLTLLFFGTLFSPPTNTLAPPEVTALKYDKATTKLLMKGLKLGVYTIDKKGILRPTKSYKILHVKEKKQFVILHQKVEYKEFSRGSGYDTVPVPGGEAMCWCLGGNDDCQFDGSDTPNNYECIGSCDCGISVILDNLKPPLQVQMPGGDWSNF